MPGSLGISTKALWKVGPEAHKLHLEFDAGAAIKAGQPLKLQTDGEVEPAAAGDTADLIIGYALTDAASTERVTVVVRGIAVVLGVAGADSQTPGPVQLGTYLADPGRLKFVAVTGADAAAKLAKLVGFALDGGDTDDEIEVLIL